MVPEPAEGYPRPIQTHEKYSITYKIPPLPQIFDR